MDKDTAALQQAKTALLQSSSLQMAIANLDYLLDFFVRNPPKDLEHYFINSPVLLGTTAGGVLGSVLTETELQDIAQRNKFDKKE